MLPTHLAIVEQRLNISGKNSSAETFLFTSYMIEVAIKTIATCLHSGLSVGSPEDAYRMAHVLIKADGLGVWDTVIRQCTNIPISGYLPKEFQLLVSWATKKRNKPEDQWFKSAKEAVLDIFKLLDSEDESIEKMSSCRDLVTALVRIRNKTKAHGAVGLDFFSSANEKYLFIIDSIIAQCPVFKWKWVFADFDSKESKFVILQGNAPFIEKINPKYFTGTTGIYIIPDESPKAYLCSNLIENNKECNEFYFPNGSVTSNGMAEYINYGTGKIKKIDIGGFSAPPPPLPSSETEGLNSLDVQSNIFGNLPLLPKGYIERKDLQTKLEDRLLDRNHAIITLHGRGGVGKTSLALFVAHKLASVSNPVFDQIVWFSARDIDLKPSGPSRVQPAVLDLAAVSRAYGNLFSDNVTVDEFAKILQGEDFNSPRKGTLFIFDNFETMSDVRQIHEFLDTYTVLPNKVLITSRERAFKADYPIEIRGMEYEEASEMLSGLSSELHIQGLINEKVIRDIYEYAEGHAYVMRVLIGEIAKEGRYVPANQVINKRIDIVDAVFERSFNKLSDSGRYVFLTISNWRSSVSELTLLVVLGLHGFDVDMGIEECKRLSLVSEDNLADGQPCYYAPQLARVFGRKKLEGDSDRLLIQEDLETIRKFGVLDIQKRSHQTQEEQINRFVSWCLSNEIKEIEQINKVDKILESVAVLWPPAWEQLATFRRIHTFESKDIEYAYRRAVEEMPFRKDVWIERAKYAKTIGDEPLYITSLVSSVDADPSDVDLVSRVALELCRYINNHKTEIPKTRRGIYLASVRSHMERIANDLNATGLSRLAWLFLLEDDKNNAWKYASLGAEIDPYNDYCTSIVKRLELDGFIPTIEP